MMPQPQFAVVLAAFFFQAAETADWRDLNRRGEESFRTGKIDESIQQFDRAIAAEPRLKAHHWQRGISLYYAGRFDDCRRQFEIHKTVNPEDVENSVWHFLCVARLKSAAEARKSLIEIHSDTRVPMMEVYSMFRGESAPEKVLAKAGTNRDALFYAHLYIALFHEAFGRSAPARKHVALAAGEFSADHYMGDVARVHLRLLPAK
jgi:lipoprotein NlpI